jgi:hypothetical protein
MNYFKLLLLLSWSSCLINHELQHPKCDTIEKYSQVKFDSGQKLEDETIWTFQNERLIRLEEYRNDSLLQRVCYTYDSLLRVACVEIYTSGVLSKIYFEYINDSCFQVIHDNRVTAQFNYWSNNHLEYKHMNDSKIVGIDSLRVIMDNGFYSSFEHKIYGLWEIGYPLALIDHWRHELVIMSEAYSIYSKVNNDDTLSKTILYYSAGNVVKEVFLINHLSYTDSIIYKYTSGSLVRQVECGHYYDNIMYDTIDYNLDEFGRVISEHHRQTNETIVFSPFKLIIQYDLAGRPYRKGEPFHVL